ncbi:MAG: dTDP-4-dehydrorhamnose reductase [Lutibacter sp.]|uniref:dTDP-4-dehydrorhamnose reductase n=1 Tax=Lutibacter sp. TaxID=1925666 RepID=UPI00385FA76F
MSTILVTGANGQLGLTLKSLEKHFSEFECFFTSKNQLNIADVEALEAFIKKNKITTIINCAAYTNVDKAEDEPILANEINHIAVENLAKLTKKNQLKLIHISTDYVFDGISETPYVENAKTTPQNVYGSSKLKGENALLAINPNNSMIIRTSWLYSEFGVNFVKTMLRLTKEKEQISVVSDQIGSPTYTADLAKTIMQIIPLLKSDGVQIYHYSNKGKCSWFQFATEIVKISKNNCKVKPVSSIEFKSSAKRPNFSLLNTNKIQKAFNLEIPHWKNSLEECISKLK